MTDTIDTKPPTQTPATIALIELEASRTYGIRLRHVPEQVEPPKPTKSTTRAPSSSPKKPAMTTDQIRKEGRLAIPVAGLAC